MCDVAVVATIGVSPSSGEFAPHGRWSGVDTPQKWKQRLRDYFKNAVPAQEWFEPWRIRLEFLGVSYGSGAAAHFGLSYRPTK